MGNATQQITKRDPLKEWTCLTCQMLDFYITKPQQQKSNAMIFLYINKHTFAVVLVGI